MTHLTEKFLSDMVVSEKERNLIELLRDIRYGQVVVYLEESQPVRIEQIKKSIKL